MSKPVCYFCRLTTDDMTTTLVMNQGVVGTYDTCKPCLAKCAIK